MRGCALLICLMSMFAPARAAASEPVAPEPPPATTGVGLVTWGSVGVVLGTTFIAGGTFIWVALGDGGGPLGVIPITFGASWVALGAVGIHVGARRRAAYRSWRSRTGMNERTWRRRYQPDRPRLAAGFGLLGGAAVSVIGGITLVTYGSERDSLVGFEPGDATPELWMSIHGTVGLVAGATMLAMGSVELHRYRRRTANPVAVRAMPIPWATPTSAGLGLRGQF
jgi:hypothetical protein